MAGQSQGAQATLRMQAAAGSDFDESYEFLQEKIEATYELIDNGAQAIRGTRSHVKERVTNGRIFVGGFFRCNPSYTELDNLFPRILGTAEGVSDDFVLAETLPSFDIRVDRVVSTHEYHDCYVDKAIFRGTKGRPVELEVHIKGGTEVTPGTKATTATMDTDFMSVFNQGVLTLEDATGGSASRNFDRFVLVIDNKLEVEHNNSNVATDICPKDREIHLSVSTPYTSTEVELYRDWHDGAVAGTPSVGGFGGTLQFTNGVKNSLFTFADLKATAISPTVPGKSQIRLPLHYKAYRSGSTLELVVVNDNTV